VNRAAQGIHVSTHHVETDAAAGQLRDLLDRRETGLKNQIMNF
jgi:hypothetical protein